MNNVRLLLGRHTDIMLIVLVLGALTVLFAPIPAALLDVLILANVSFALLLLLLTFHMRRPVDFSTFPSLLLIATLCRLALNVAATRLILTDADAGKVIQSVGSYVVSGNYVIGLIVFLILVVVQYVVVTSGAQRVSEVAARFALDSMPGQQMSIDADLNMGFIDQVEAQRRRKELEKQATFYGSMDGASKFVKGDAIAGILILIINIVGGLIIGVMQQGMPWGEALRVFTLLTVGDGIVTQIPALVIAVGTGIIVTRSATDENLSAEIVKQLLSFPKAVWLVMLAIAVIGMMPGIPFLPVLMVLVLLTGLALSAKWFGEATTMHASSQEVGGKDGVQNDSIPAVLPIRVRIAADLTGLADGDEAPLVHRVSGLRNQLANDLGVVLPSVKFDVDTTMAPHCYEISVYGISCGKGEIIDGRTMAIHASGDTKSLPGLATREPTYGLAAIWIEDSERDRARAARFTLVDPATVFMTHFSETIRNRCSELITRAEAEKLLARVRVAQPGLVEEVVPTTLSVVDVQKVLQNLLREKVSILHMEAIIETLADIGRSQKDPNLLTEAVRLRLSAAICQQLMADGAALQVLTVEPNLEHQLRLAMTDAGQRQALPPKLMEQILVRITAHAEQMMRKNLLPVLLCAQDLRRHLRQLTERAVPHMRVLSVTEVPGHVPLKSFGTIGLSGIDSNAAEAGN